MKTSIFLTILTAACMLMAVWGIDRAATDYHQLEENAEPDPTVQFGKTEVCSSFVVERNPAWLDLAHVCYNAEYGWHFMNVPPEMNDREGAAFQVVKERVRSEAKKKGLYNPNHSENWGTE